MNLLNSHIHIFKNHFKLYRHVLFIGFLSFIIFFIKAPIIYAQQHPRVLVKPGDKEAVLSKIENTEWANSIYTDYKKRLKPFVNRHQKNPEWILSRYLMNWEKGEHYTDFKSDPGGKVLVDQSGNAPNPTVRVDTHKRSPVTKDGYGFRVPKINELIPYDTSRTMRLQSRGPNHYWKRVDPQAMISTINGRINKLALQSSILYWLTGKDKYAKFASDILLQWARGAQYQHPIKGAGRDGYLSMQTLGDANYALLALVYDFVYPYLIKTNKDTSIANTVLKRLAQTQVKRGFVGNNWFAAETPTLVWSALALDDASERKDLMQYFLDKNYVHGGMGQLSVKTALQRMVDAHGHWEEAPGYHNYPIRQLYKAGLAAENNRYNVFGQYSKLLKSASVIYKYSFPNGQAMDYGDTGKGRQSAIIAEIGYLMAQKYNNKAASDTLGFILKQLIKKGRYHRKNAGFIGLLNYKPIYDEDTISSISLLRAASLPYARLYLQRNVNGKFDLMSYVQGAMYNHNHANGMAMELYGEGFVLGADPGHGANYDTRKHRAYYIQAGAHNTVVSAPQLPRTVPFSLGTRKMGYITLDSMEPKPGKEAVSPYYSYSITSYVDTTTRILTHQQRTMAVVRTSNNAGYYVDVYRSDNSMENDYLYHNIGRSLKLYDESGQVLSTKSTNDFQKDFGDQGAGFQYFRNQNAIKNYTGNLRAKFSFNGTDTLTNEKNISMNVFMPAADTAGRSYYKALAPRTHTAPSPYDQWPTPTLIVRQHGPAWNHPFIAVYEPDDGQNKMHIDKVEKVNTRKENFGSKVLRIISRKDSLRQTDYIFNDNNSGNQTLKVPKNVSFTGHFGIASFREGELYSLYLGKGRKIESTNYRIESINSTNVSASLWHNNGEILLSSNQPVYVTLLNVSGIKKSPNEVIRVFYQEKDHKPQRTAFKLLTPDKKSSRIRIELPAVHSAKITLQHVR